MDFDKTMWSCPWNSDETVQKSLPGMKGSRGWESRGCGWGRRGSGVGESRAGGV